MGLDRMYWLTDSEHRRLGFSGRASTNAGYDIHVIRGATSRPLRGEIVFVDSAASKVFTLTSVHPTSDVLSLRFVPRFVPEDNAGGKIKGHGAEIEIDTGRVTGIAPTGAHRVHNFILEAIAEVKAPSEPGGKKILAPLRVRVHVH